LVVAVFAATAAKSSSVGLLVEEERISSVTFIGEVTMVGEECRSSQNAGLAAEQPRWDSTASVPDSTVLAKVLGKPKARASNNTSQWPLNLVLAVAATGDERVVITGKI